MSNIITIDNLNYFYNHGEPTEVQALSNININIEIEKGGYFWTVRLRKNHVALFSFWHRPLPFRYSGY